MPAEDHVWPVVETGAAYRPVIQPEAGGSHDMKRNVGGRAKPRDVSRVGWDLWLNECDANHRRQNSASANVFLARISVMKIQKERRDSLEVLVVPFERPAWPVEVCVRQLRVAVLP